MSQGYKIAPNWNVSLGSLVDITAISVNGKPFADPKVIPFYSPGQRLIRADGSVYNAGFAEVTWQFGFMFFDQYYYLSSTYCGGGWSGEVTILTSLANIGSFARMNAQLIMPQQTELKAGLGWFTDVPIKFTMLVPSS